MHSMFLTSVFGCLTISVLRGAWHVLELYSWLSSSSFGTCTNSFSVKVSSHLIPSADLALRRHTVSPMIMLCARSSSYWCFWMHSMYSTAVLVNITLHYFALHCITMHYNALHCLTFTKEPGEGGRMDGNRSKWFIRSNNGAPKPVRHENDGGCIKSAPNSLLKQIQLHLAS